ncbi:MAG: phosphoglucosamine mutase [Bacteriovoracaceae bacterium]|nr:phosphoglucosamine mutase [Bacteriovoracaceae bacterium]
MKNEKRELFGTDGIRGKANVHPMTCEIAMGLGRAVTSYFQKKEATKQPLIIIGKDTRLSCYTFEHAFSAGVCSQGGYAIFTGPLPTPGVAFVTKSMRADAGVMISASHNPYYDNGIKIFDRNGYKLPDDVEYELEKMVLQPELLKANVTENLGRARRLDEVIGRYIEHAKSCFDNSYSLEGIKLVVDCANGAAYKLAPMIFEELGAEIIVLGNTPNGKNINENCGALHPQNCAAKVKEVGADMGICLDGDADRLIVIDEKGEVIDGDKLIGFLSKFLFQKKLLGGVNEVVGTAMSNLGLEIYLKKLGLSLFRTKVGDRYVIERMRESGSVFGGENSGHLIFNRHSTTGDGILAALKVIECMKYFDRSLHDLAKEVELYPQVLKNVKVKTKTPFEDVPAIQKGLAEVQAELGDEARILLRYSGTEALARVMIEGKNKDLVEKSCQKLVQIVEASLK